MLQGGEGGGGRRGEEGEGGGGLSVPTNPGTLRRLNHLKPPEYYTLTPKTLNLHPYIKPTLKPKP